MVQNPAWGRKSAQIAEPLYSTAFRVEQTNWTLAMERDEITASVARDAHLAGDRTACFREFRHSRPLMEPPANFLLVYWLTAMFLQSVPKRQTKHELFAVPPHQHAGPLKQPGIFHRPRLGKLAHLLTSVYVCDVCSGVPAVSGCILPLSPEPSVIHDALGFLCWQHNLLPSSLNPHLAVKSSIIRNFNVRKLVPISLQKLQRIWISWRRVILCFSGGKPAHSELCGTLR